MINDKRDTPNRIVMYWHCKQCVTTIPSGKTPALWARLSVGMTNDGNVQIWCERHQCNVALIGGEEA